MVRVKCKNQVMQNVMRKAIFLLLMTMLLFKTNAMKMHDSVPRYLPGEYLTTEKIYDVDWTGEKFEKNSNVEIFPNTRLNIIEFKIDINNEVFGQVAGTGYWIMIRDEHKKEFVKYMDLLGIYLIVDSDSEKNIGICNINFAEGPENNYKADMYYENTLNKSDESIVLNTNWYTDVQTISLGTKFLMNFLKTIIVTQIGKDLFLSNFVSNQRDAYLFSSQTPAVSNVPKDLQSNWGILLNDKNRSYVLFKISSIPTGNVNKGGEAETESMLETTFNEMNNHNYRNVKKDNELQQIEWIQTYREFIINSESFQKFKSGVSDVFKNKFIENINPKKHFIEKTSRNWWPLYILIAFVILGGAGYYVYVKYYTNLECNQLDNESDEENTKEKKKISTSKLPSNLNSQSASESKSISRAVSAFKSNHISGSRELTPVDDDIEHKMEGLCSESISHDIEFQNVPHQKKNNQSESNQ